VSVPVPVPGPVPGPAAGAGAAAAAAAGGDELPLTLAADDDADDAEDALLLLGDEADEGQFIGTAAFEFRVLEGILRAVSDKYDRRLHCYDPVITNVLGDLALVQWQSNAILRLLPLKNALVSFERASDEVLSVLTGLLTSNEDMLELFLTEKRRRHGRLPPLEAHQDCELLLETFHREFSQVKFEAQQLRRKILATEDMVRISMDAHRNRLIQMQAHIAMCSVGVGAATLMTGIFGMNLPNGLEGSHAAFLTVALSSVCLVGATYMTIHRGFLRRPVAARHFVTVTSPKTLEDMAKLKEALDGTFDFQDVILQLERQGDLVSREDLARTFEEARGKLCPEEILDLIFQLYAGDAKAGWITMEQLRLFLCDFPSVRWTGRTY